MALSVLADNTATQ